MNPVRESLLYVFGCNSHGQLGYQGKHHCSKPRLVTDFYGMQLRDVWCGAGCTYVVSESGDVFVAADNSTSFTKVKTKTKIRNIAGCSLYTLALDYGGDVYFVGGPQDGMKLNVKKAKALSTGCLFAAILTVDGSVFTLGMDVDCSLGYETIPGHNVDTISLQTPKQVPITDLIISMSCGATHTVCLTSKGELVGWGTACDGELSPAHTLPEGEYLKSTLPVLLNFNTNTDTPIVDIYCGDRTTALSLSDGSVRGFGKNRQTCLGLNGHLQIPHSDIKSVSLGGGWNNSHTLVATSDAVFSIGSNSTGQLGVVDSLVKADSLQSVGIPFESFDEGAIKGITISAGWVHSAILLSVTESAFSTSLFSSGNGVLSLLPVDTLLLIILFTPQSDRPSLGITSRNFLQAYKRDEVWKHKTGLNNETSYYSQLLVNNAPPKENPFSALWSRIGTTVKVNREHRMLMLGLDAAGKTSLLYKMKLPSETFTTIPTIGFNVETIEHGNTKMTFWDIGGPDKLRALWRHYFEVTDALVFVLDINDRDRLLFALDEFITYCIGAEEMEGVPLLIFANKSDLPRALSPDELQSKMSSFLSAPCMRNRPWLLQRTDGKTGDGIAEGLSWLNTTLKHRTPRASKVAK
eukprot:TRINITY_DN4306_c0_g1_i1.p1 TRINITY_DN4306_c0_g1~~TRINITY_DN4306_c0_g1_i1.p1  ORF type:complete len:652 (+),score=106.39 TRINITY_DN4306_c0_g1_i1:57-1958(+)